MNLRFAFSMMVLLEITGVLATNREEIKNYILNELGLKHAPNMTGKSRLTDRQISIIKDRFQNDSQALEHKEEIIEPEIKTVFVFAQPRKFIFISFRSL